MQLENIINLIVEAGYYALIFSAIPLTFSSLIGLFIAVLQAVTQIQDQSLSYLPKLIIICVVMFLGGGYALELMTEYFRQAMSLEFFYYNSRGAYVF